MPQQTIRTAIDSRGLATLTLSRPEVHNAINETLIAELGDALVAMAGDSRVRAVVLSGEGRSFCAGADLEWMRRTADYSAAQNLEDARGLARLMRQLDTFSKPTIAAVQGSAYGGGVGLVACCDIAIASERATFSFPEARLGLIPAVISPYVVAAIGARQARRYFLTGERFSAAEARRIGLVHEVAAPESLPAALEALASALFQGGPEALRAAKDLIRTVANRVGDDGLMEETARRIAGSRASEEARHGTQAFLEKRKPRWQQSS